ncbi:MAG TPA: FAD-binding oxidoreductase [Kofleriaceae bacterium]|nr:FAD-binding oxidoreductase [Kofleriaceae bacterium]
MCYKTAVPELPQRAAVVIIGGGFAGAATAWALRRAGVRDVIVLEREIALGRFASGRSAGLGRQLAEDDHTTALTVRGAQLLREMPSVWTPSGSILSFDNAASADAYVQRAQRFGVPVEIGDRAAVVARWPVGELKVAKALYVASDGTIDVTALLRELVTGTRVEVNCAVARVEPHRVVTAKGAIEARVIVDATGAWAGMLTGDEPLLAYKRHVFIIESESAPGPWLWHLGAGELYLRHDGEGVLTSPCDAARSEAGHQEPDLVGEAHMRKVLEDAEMPLASAMITRRWACQRAYTPDRKMRLGSDDHRPWLVWAAGLGGHGATAAPAVGEAVAAAVLRRLQSGQ